MAPHTPNARKRPGEAGALLGNGDGRRTSRLPPTLGSAPAKPGHSSGTRFLFLIREVGGEAGAFGDGQRHLALLPLARHGDLHALADA